MVPAPRPRRPALAIPLLASLLLPALAGAQAFTRARLDTADYMGEWVASAQGKDGLPFIAYYDFAIKGVKTLKCGDRTCSAGNVFNRVDTVGLMGWFISLRIGQEGLPSMTHFDVTREDLRFIRCGDPSCSAGNSLVVIDSAGETGRFNSLALDGQALPIISYHDVTEGDLRLAFCGAPACDDANTVFSRPDTAGITGLHTTVLLAADGLPVISYYDATRGDLKVLKCLDRHCSVGAEPVTVDSAGRVGEFAVMVLGKDGNPFIAYQDGLGGLKAARCGDPGCRAGNVVTRLIGSETVGGRMGLALDLEGRPVITYSSRGPNDLMALRCGDASCASPLTRHRIDSGGELGLYSSIWFDAQGRAFVAYSDLEPYDLKAAWCDGPACWAETALDLRPMAAPRSRRSRSPGSLGFRAGMRLLVGGREWRDAGGRRVPAPLRDGSAP